MKKYTILSIGMLVLMLVVGGIAFGEGSMGGTSGQSDPGMGSSSSQDSMGMGGTSGQQGAGAMQGKIDLNTASASELESVPGISKSMASNIIKYRDQNGPFSSVDDLSKVKGIDNKKLNAIRENVTVSGAAGTGGTDGMGTGGTSGTDGMGTGDSSGTGTGGTDGMGTGGTSGTGTGGTDGTSGTDGMGTDGTASPGNGTGSSGY